MKNTKATRKIAAALAAVMAMGTMAAMATFGASADNSAVPNGTEVNAYGKHPGEAGYNFSFEDSKTNAMGKHPGEAGYNYKG